MGAEGWLVSIKTMSASTKRKKVTFKEVNYGDALKVQFVNDNFPDFKVKVSDNDAFSTKIIEIEIMNYSPDVKLQVVDCFEDFEIFME